MPLRHSFTEQLCRCVYQSRRTRGRSVPAKPASWRRGSSPPEQAGGIAPPASPGTAHEPLGSLRSHQLNTPRSPLRILFAAPPGCSRRCCASSTASAQAARTPVPLHHAARARVTQSESGGWGRWEGSKDCRECGICINHRAIDRLSGRRYSRGQSKEAFNFSIRCQQVNVGQGGEHRSRSS